MSSQSISRGIGAFSCSDDKKVRRVKYTELWTFSLSEQETRQPLNYYTGDLSSNGDKQWERTRAMACTAPTTAPTRRMIRSTMTHPAMSLASRQITRALARRRMLFFSFSGNSNPFRIHDFFQVGKSKVYQ